MSEVMPIRLTPVDANHLHEMGLQCLHCLNAVASEALSQGLCRWFVLPKVHLFHHMAIDTKREQWNPRGYHNFSGESYMGILKKMVIMANRGPKLEERILRRALLRLQVGVRLE